MSDQKSSPQLETLPQAAQGLLFISETDAPLVPLFWPDATDGEFTSDRLSELAGLAHDQPIKSIKLESFFRPATKAEEWHDDEEKAEVEKFKVR